MDDAQIDAGIVGPGEYAPAGEEQGQAATFGSGQIADAFAVAPERVRAALQGEFGLGPSDRVTSHQAQHLVEVILGDQPLDEQQAALMRLGAFTPRADHEWGLGETAPGEESDRLAADPDVPPDQLASRRSSHSPIQPSE